MKGKRNVLSKTKIKIKTKTNTSSLFPLFSSFLTDYALFVFLFICFIREYYINILLILFCTSIFTRQTRHYLTFFTHTKSRFNHFNQFSLFTDTRTHI